MEIESAGVYEPWEEIKTVYLAPGRYDSNQYYDLESLRKFEQSAIPHQLVGDSDFKSDFFWLENGIGYCHIQITTLNGWKSY